MNTSQTLKSGLLLVTLLSSIILSAQNSSALQDNECYVVVGAFKLEKNAKAFASALTPDGFSAEHRFNSHRNLHYVFTHHSVDREEAKSDLFEIREQYSKLQDAWLYAGNFKGPHITSDEWAALMAKSENQNMGVEESLEEEPGLEETDLVKEEPEAVVEEEPEAALPPLEPGSFRVYLNTTNATTGEEVSGKFSVIDMERNKEHSTVEAQQLLTITPKNGTNRLKFVSGIFGFKTDDHLIDLDEPMTESNSKVEVTGDTIIIDFELARYKKGEFAVLWKVYFYKDAAIMKEESVYELYQLLQMMKSDDNMKIKIHGHTNGNSKGKVLHLDLDDKEFFSLNGSHNEDVASAKKLSEYRAYTIQHWLMDQGIAEERMEIIGWGGKKMLFDKHDDQAHQNVRVEIEVLETS